MKGSILLFIIILSVKQINAQTISTVAGNGTDGFTGDNGQATSAELNNPTNVAFDALNNIYIIDSNRIRKINTLGIITTIVGNGVSGFSGDGGQATNAELSISGGIAFDSVGNLYFSDAGNNRVRKVSTSGIINTVIGNGVSGSSGDGGQASNAEINRPVGICIDVKGNIYFSDAGNNRIRKVNTLGIITTITGGGSCGSQPCGDGGQATLAELNQPLGLSIDVLGNIFIADFSNSRVRKVDTSGIITFIAGNNNWGGYSGDNGAATHAALNGPTGITVDGIGNIYIADNNNNRIRKINNLGIISTIIGGGTPGYNGDGISLTNAEINFPYGLAIDVSGNLYIADTYNNRIRKITNAAQAGIYQVVNNKTQVTIYPNPTTGDLYLCLNKQNAGNVVVNITDMNGRLLLSNKYPANVGANNYNLDVSSLENGVYAIAISDDGGTIIKQDKIILTK